MALKHTDELEIFLNDGGGLGFFRYFVLFGSVLVFKAGVSCGQ